MTGAVVYYSFEGNTAHVAEAIAAATGLEAVRLRVRDEAHPTGFMKYVWGGRAVVTRKTPELEPLPPDLVGRDVFFLGTPVWAFTYAPAMRSFLTGTSLRGKRVALFACCDGGPGRVFRHMHDALPGNEFLGEKLFISPLRRGADAAAADARAWAKAVFPT